MLVWHLKHIRLTRDRRSQRDLAWYPRDSLSNSPDPIRSCNHCNHLILPQYILRLSTSTKWNMYLSLKIWLPRYSEPIIVHFWYKCFVQTFATWRFVSIMLCHKTFCRFLQSCAHSLKISQVCLVECLLIATYQFKLTAQKLVRSLSILNIYGQAWSNECILLCWCCPWYLRAGIFATRTLGSVTSLRVLLITGVFPLQIE